MQERVMTNWRGEKFPDGKHDIQT